MPIVPMIAARNAVQALEFYQKVFDAKIVEGPYTDANGKVDHSEISIGGNSVMVADEQPGHNRTPDSLGGTSVLFLLPVPDFDRTHDLAIQSGANLVRPVSTLPDGQRLAKLQDPYGHIWMIHGK